MTPGKRLVAINTNSYHYYYYCNEFLQKGGKWSIEPSDLWLHNSRLANQCDFATQEALCLSHSILPGGIRCPYFSLLELVTLILWLGR